MSFITSITPAQWLAIWSGASVLVALAQKIWPNAAWLATAAHWLINVNKLIAPKDPAASPKDGAS
jgi:hypothetical protein